MGGRGSESGGNYGAAKAGLTIGKDYSSAFGRETKPGAKLVYMGGDTFKASVGKTTQLVTQDGGAKEISDRINRQGAWKTREMG